MEIKSKFMKEIIYSLDKQLYEFELEGKHCSEQYDELVDKYYKLTQQVKRETEYQEQRINKAVSGEFVLDTMSVLLINKIQSFNTIDEVKYFIAKLINEVEND